LEGVFLYNIDDLEDVVADHAMERSRELEQCKAIIHDEVEHFPKGFQSYAAGPLITELRAKAEPGKEEERIRRRARFPDLHEPARKGSSAFSARRMHKLRHRQIQGIKEQRSNGNSDSLRMIAQGRGVDAQTETAQPEDPEAHA